MEFEFKGIKIPSSGELEQLETLQESFKNQKELIDSEFYTFSEKARGIIAETEEVLKTPYDNNPTQLEEDLQTFIQWGLTLGQLIADANSFYTIYQTMFHYAKAESKTTTEDRKRYVDAKTIPYKRLLDYLRNLEDKIEKKISVGQSILKYESNKRG